LNLYLVRLQKGLGSLHLYGSPIKLTIEASNACNLRCPYCFTGAGEVGRQKTMLQMPLYKKALDELGDRLFVVEFYNWGEPLLNKNIFEMIRIASDRKVSTMISTNFSLPFDEERAEKLVESRLAVLGVSLDGAWQESYEQYRVGGNLETILRNVRLVNEAKRKANSKYPHIIWEYHIFSHNRTSEEIETARRMAQELDMEFALSKGWVAGKDWDTNKEFADPDHKPDPGHCEMLWQQAVINGEGGVAPCCAAYYKEDDFGLFSDGTSVPLSELATQPFRSVWNNENFREARKLFRTRVNASPLGRSLICYDCPITVIWDQYKRHRALGLPPDRFEYGFDPNDGFNYFFDRRPPRDQSKKNGVAPADVIELTPAAKP
jgi:MoaA/NifB/PqqE/SkfB family radical SAM enzyme